MNYDDPVKVIAMAAFMAAVAALLAYAMVIALPFAAVGAGWMGYKWYTNQPHVRLRKGRERAHELYAALKRAQEAAKLPAPDDFGGAVWDEVAKRRSPDLPSFDLASKIMSMGRALYAYEGLMVDVVEPPELSEIEEAKYRDHISGIHRKLAIPKVADLVRDAIANSVIGFCEHLPAFAFQKVDELLVSAKAETLVSQFSIRTTDCIDDLGQAVEDTIMPFYRSDLGPLFHDLRESLDALQHRVSHVPFDVQNRHSAKLIMPSNHDGNPLDFVEGTPLLMLFDTQLPFEIKGDIRFSGMWVVAPPGRGKTTLLSNLLESDLDAVAEGKASVILMDSKGDLVGEAKRLQMFAPGGKLHGKLVLIEPWETLAINPLDLGASTGHTIALLEYVFSSLLESQMTPLQGTLFRAVLILCKAIPNANFFTFRDILLGGWRPYEGYVRALDREDALFFAGGEFDSQTYKKTREELTWRIRDLTTRVPLLRGMFRAEKTLIDIGKEMDAGKVIIIDNSVATLSAGSEFFSRFFIALVRSAAEQRAGRKQADKMPVYFYIDEADTVISRDESVREIIQRCRSQNIAMIFAHQALQQIKSDDVKAALTDCAIRLANSDEEAPQLAPRMRTDPEFLRDLKRGEFATFIRDKTKKAIALSVPNKPVSKWPKMSLAQLDEIRGEMKSAYCCTREKPKAKSVYEDGVDDELEDEAEEEKEFIDAEFVEVGYEEKLRLTYDSNEPPSTPQPKRRRRRRKE